MSATENIALITEGINEIRTELASAREERKTINADLDTLRALEAKIDGLEAKHDAYVAAKEANEEGFLAPGAKPYDPVTGKGFSLSRACNAFQMGAKNADEWAKAGAAEEYDILEQCKLFSWQQKDQGMMTDSTGGFAVPENLVPGLLELLQANTIFNAATIGCFEMPAVPGTMKFNRVATGYTPSAQAAEGDAYTESTMTIEQINLEPKVLSVYCEASRLLLANNVAGADAWITRQLAKDASITHDQWVLRGTGSNGQPLGLLNDPDIGTAAVSATADFDEIEDIRLAVATANGIMGTKMAWAMHPAMESQIRFAASGVTNVDMVRMSRTEGPNSPLIGHPVYLSTNFSATTDADSIVFGAWDELIIANFSGYMIESSDHYKFQNGLRAFALSKYMDTHRLQPGAFCKAT